MSKCRMIDRIALTKGELKFVDDSKTQPEEQPAKDIQPEQHGEICPECGKRTFFPEAGCWNCKSCGYNYCDARR